MDVTGLLASYVIQCELYCGPFGIGFILAAILFLIVRLTHQLSVSNSSAFPGAAASYGYAEDRDDAAPATGRP